MPQIAQIAATYASQLFWLLLVFGTIFVVIGLGMYPKIQGTVIARDRKIEDDLAEARRANEAADRLEEDYRKKLNEEHAAAHQAVEKARAEAARETERKLAAAGKENDVLLQSAKADLAERRKAARREIEDVATEAARDLVAKLSGIQPEQGEAAREVREIMHGTD